MVPGCAVTDIEEVRGGLVNQKTYQFWIVWPYDKEAKEGNTPKSENGTGQSLSILPFLCFDSLISNFAIIISCSPIRITLLLRIWGI